MPILLCLFAYLLCAVVVGGVCLYLMCTIFHLPPQSSSYQQPVFVVVVSIVWLKIGNVAAGSCSRVSPFIWLACSAATY